MMDDLFFISSKVLWLSFRPDIIILFFLVLVWFFLWKKSYKKARQLLVGTLLSMLIIAIIPIGSMLLHPLESQFETNPKLPTVIDGVIVLSGAIGAEHSRAWDQVEVGSAADRLIMFMKLAREYPSAQLIFSGGSGSLFNQKDKDADIAKRFFREQGLDISRIVFERESRNTFESALFSYRIIEPNIDENWILITTAWHMPRAVGSFCKIGWPVIPYPVDHKTYPNQKLSLGFNLNAGFETITRALKAWIGMIAYYVAGKSDKLLPIGCHV